MTDYDREKFGVTAIYLVTRMFVTKIYWVICSTYELGYEVEFLRITEQFPIVAASKQDNLLLDMHSSPLMLLLLLFNIHVMYA